MEAMMPPLPILAQYGFDLGKDTITVLSSGLINRTWKITSGAKSFILQRINHNVFKQPRKIAQNIRLIQDYLSKNAPGYLFVGPAPSLGGEDMVIDPVHGYFRLFPFLERSFTLEVVTHEDQAYQAALQFGRFSHNLSGFDASLLEDTIPDFHNLALRYDQFEQSLIVGNVERINEARTDIAELKKHYPMVETYMKIKSGMGFRRRVLHHDTKISNVLFDQFGKGLCVIDLDTVMSGFYISDVGDMMRTYLSPANEEVNDLDKIEVRESYYQAIVSGYLEEMRGVMTEEEKHHFFYSGLFIIYMQALRFLADHFNDDVYYGARYEGHNLMRARNQIRLLQCLLQKETVLNQLVKKELGLR